MMTSEGIGRERADAQQAVRGFLEDALVALNHELRTPLAVMKGYTSTLLRYDRRLPRRERLEMLREIASACDRMAQTIEQTTQGVLQVGASASLEIEPVDLGRLAREAAAEIDARLLKDGAVPRVVAMISDDEAAPIVLGDAHHLRQVLLRLLDNAVRYSSPEAPVTIAVAREPAQRLTGHPRVVVQVRDRGRGIPPEKLSRIFDPFSHVESRLTQGSSGLGLSLAYCRRTIERHGGTIWCESIEGQGTTFSFALPLSENAVHPRPLNRDISARRPGSVS
jgi:signal transduction histidine kinase